MTAAARHRAWRRWPLLLAALFAAAAACSDGGGGGAADAGTDTSTDTGSDQPIEWTIEQVEDANMGYQARLAVDPGGAPAVAYWSNLGFEDGICDEIEVDPPPRVRYELRFAQRTGPGQWAAETIDEPEVAFTPNGLDLAFDPDGRPAVAYTGGTPEMVYCGGNDAVLAVRDGGSWSFETAAATSGQAATGEPASDSGHVVGLWPGLAHDPQGEPAILYKDAHFGTLQHDDLYRADAELAWRAGGSWDQEAVDPGEGAGEYGDLVFDGEGRPVAFYAITVDAQENSRHGVWAARRDAEGTYELVKLHSGAIHQEISAAVHPASGDLIVAFYSVADMAVRVRRLGDPAQFTDSGAWSSELVGKAQYDEGQNVSLALAPSGRVALAYHRCRLVTSGSAGCDQNDEAVIFAIENEDSWSYDVVVESQGGSCGDFTSLQFDAAGDAYIAYRCTVQIGEEFTFRPFVAIGAVEAGS
jgi:hypothetical protein